MSEFLKLAWELISKFIYNIAEWVYNFVRGFIQVFITGWVDYFVIFRTYFVGFSWPVRILSILLALILIAIPVLVIVLVVRKVILHFQLKADKGDNTVLYKEIGRLNRQVLNLMDEKNKILALKVNSMGGVGRIPYVGASALTDDTIPTVENVVGTGAPAEGTAGGAAAAAGTVASAGTVAAGGTLEISEKSAAAAATAMVKAKQEAEHGPLDQTSRFPKLALVDQKYVDYVPPQFDNEITLEEFTENFRLFACSRMHLYYTPEIIRRFVAGMASSRLLILEGISGTGKTSLPYSFSRYLNNPSTIVSVQPSYRDRTELLGYFNEFSKRFNETEFLRALYEANYRQEPSFIVLDEMNLARIEYYFAEMLSVLEMPSHDEWVLDLVPTAWPGDPKLLNDGKIHVPDTLWFVGTANNDDSTFTITDKVYDRAIPIELNERADAFECADTPPSIVTAAHLEQMFQQAKQQHPISQATLDKMNKLNEYLMTRFKLTFGNRIIKQMHDFIPVYVACGGTELGGLDYIIARKVLKKFESLNVVFVRDEIKGLIAYMDKVCGRTAMPDSKAYLTRIQNLY
ncbi:MAG: AAA family ATPase [Firmicutes bacterium]|nr:AAA family ATPase [Bacillota bacterium]